MKHIRVQNRTIGQKERIAMAEERLKKKWLECWYQKMPKPISKNDMLFAVKEAEAFAAKKVAEIATLIEATMPLQ